MSSVGPFRGGPYEKRLFRPNLVCFRPVFETLLPYRAILLALPTGKRIPDIIGSNVEQTYGMRLKKIRVRQSMRLLQPDAASDGVAGRKK